MYVFGLGLGATADTDHVRKAPPAELRLERSERAYPISGVVLVGSHPLDYAIVTAGTESRTTDATGTFSFDNAPLGTITVKRPGYYDYPYEFDGSVTEADIPMKARIIKAIHVSSTWSLDDAEYQRLLDLADVTTVNAFVLDAKGDNGRVDYATKVQVAIDNGLIEATTYNVEERLAQAKERGLYTIVRIPAFSDGEYARAFPEQAIGYCPPIGACGVDPAEPEARAYNLALAVEACELLGFDEIQFDYIRYPTVHTSKTPDTPEERVAVIRTFLEEARDLLHPMGCALSADSFGEPAVKFTDTGIGQLLEEFSAPLDAYTPMGYPELWDPGWFGLPDPQNHPVEVTEGELDGAMPRVAEWTVVRPYLQVSWHQAAGWCQLQIAVAEDRDLGWVIWDSWDDPLLVSSFPAGGPGEG
jgi:hypothetical protein